MACHYVDSCPFPKDKMAAMPVTTSFMVENYCHWDFTKEHGIRNLPCEEVHDTGCCLSDKILNMLISGRLGW